MKFGLPSAPPSPIPNGAVLLAEYDAWKRDKWPVRIAIGMGAAIVLLALWAAFSFAHMTGYSAARSEIWAAEVRNCTRTEEREFADVGWFIFKGSGEIQRKRVCVEWRVTR